jgi:hypothetical protein
MDRYEYWAAQTKPKSIARNDEAEGREWNRDASVFDPFIRSKHDFSQWIHNFSRVDGCTRDLDHAPDVGAEYGPDTNQ